MESTSSQSLKKFHQAKDNGFHAQIEKVYQAFQEMPMTMKEADVSTGIMRENICRYVAILVKRRLIVVRRIRKCRITGYPDVKEYTGDPNLFPESNQLKMF